MYVLIPLGGLGNRFKEFNYKLPKPLIKVFGKPIIFWLIDNLHIDDNITIIIPYNKELEHYNFEDILIKQYPKYKFLFFCLNNLTNGASETVLLTLNKFKLKNIPIILIDGDNFYTENIINKWNGENKIFVFEDKNDSSCYSYITTKNKNVLDIQEKNKISDLACCGAYGFKSVDELQYYCEKIISSNIKSKGEFYISTVIKEMINNDNHFQYDIINQKNYSCLGTPFHVRLFCNNYPKNKFSSNENLIKPIRFCFDLDNTLVTYPKISGDYSSVEPINKNIDFLKYLKSFGHIIIINTARRMKTHNNNIGKVMCDIGKITFETLYKFKIPYDEIYFGKPHADFYIDDLAVNAYDNLEKITGFYKNTIEPRDFNSITHNSINIIKKQSKNGDLKGEIYYYNNIPCSIKDMFPIFINYDYENFLWYEIEHINGISISKLYLNEQLTTIQLNNIMDSIIRIHNVNINEIVKLDIYYNYIDKLKLRFNSYDYSKFDNYLKVYNNLLIKLENYKNNDMGQMSVIHGDPVFTNLFVNQYDKIKFIDMRGVINNTLTIYGDSLYDWGKIYQSLIGYDEILENSYIDEKYKKNLINFFENKIINNYGIEYLNNIKLITNSLLFTLIPLHDNEKCSKYFNLIQTLDN